MTATQRFNRVIPKEYTGRILTGDFSVDLKKQVAGYYNTYHQFERTGNPAIPYISAWREGEKEIWYEFVAKRLVQLLGCEPHEVAAVLRDSIVDRIIYKTVDMDVPIQKEIFSREELDRARTELREDVERKGIIDAVYKLSLEPDRLLWVKDLAVVETYGKDRICLSFGSLTIVTKEMRAEEERVERERLQVSLEMAGTVCHELNQPMQSISGYSESLLMDFQEESPVRLKVQKIIELTRTVSEIAKKLTKITRYETTDYVEGVKIVDLDKSTKQ